MSEHHDPTISSEQCPSCIAARVEARRTTLIDHGGECPTLAQVELACMEACLTETQTSAVLDHLRAIAHQETK